MPYEVLAGNTVRLKAAFYDWEDKPEDPDEAQVYIYLQSRQAPLVFNPVKVDGETGQYFYDYNVPFDIDVFDFEFRGRSGEGYNTGIERAYVAWKRRENGEGGDD